MGGRGGRQTGEPAYFLIGGDFVFGGGGSLGSGGFHTGGVYGG